MPRNDQIHAARPKSKILEFPVSTVEWPTAWPDAAAAFAAADLHREAILANGDTWATPGWPGSGPLYRAGSPSPAAGILFGLRQTTVPDPAGTRRIDWTSTEWVIPEA